MTVKGQLGGEISHEWSPEGLAISAHGSAGSPRRIGISCSDYRLTKTRRQWAARPLPNSRVMGSLGTCQF
jgi:hypothetical protein